MSIIYLILAFVASFTQSQDSDGVAAIVGDHKITIARVERHLQRMVGEDNFEESMRARLLGESLEHLVRRHFVLSAVRDAGILVGPGELRLETEKLRDRLKEIELSLEEYLISKSLPKSELEYEFTWRIAWQKYLDRHLTKKQLQKFFDKNRRQFDGTEMHVAHLLFTSLKDVDEIKKLATQIQRDIQEGKISWNDAVKRNSDAKSSIADGGEIGWVTFDGPMPPEFCQAAMKLEVGQVSPPVQSIFGIHLIKCLEIRPGKLGPDDAANEIKKVAARYLFDTLSKKKRKQVSVQYKVDWPQPKMK